MNETEQQLFFSRINELLEQAQGFRKDTVFAMIEPALAEYDSSLPSVTLSFPGKAWEQNSNGVLHGGIIASLMDVAMGTLTYALTGTITPTMNLNISYPRPAIGNGIFFVRAELIKAGRTALYTTGTLYEAGSQSKVISVAQGVFFNPTGNFLGNI